MRAIVVGAGVVGLTTAVCLREAGVDADVVARDPPQDTTSAVAAALWYPYRALPAERVTAWSATSYEALARLAGVAGSGVRMRTGTELLPADAPDPWWRDAVRVTAPGVQEWLLDQSDPADLVYVVPRERDVVLGGTAEEGREDRTPDAATTAAIRARCAALLPELRGAPVVGVAVGLRPVRPEVRLEADGRVVHCYGHGGAGVTLAWGCAVEVAALLGAGAGRYPPPR